VPIFLASWQRGSKEKRASSGKIGEIAGTRSKTVPVITFIASTFNIERMARMDFLFEINNSISFAFQWQNVPDKSSLVHQKWALRGGGEVAGWAKSGAFVASEIYLTLQKLPAKECESI